MISMAHQYSQSRICFVKMIKHLFVVFFTIMTSVNFAQSQSAKLYEIVASESAEEVMGYLKEVGETRTAKENAQKGVLLMRSAEYEVLPTDKLAAFKEGRELLEASIMEEPDNAEFRFFRLLIQENAPRMLRYSDSIQVDIASIIASYSGLPKDLKNAILAYSKTSKALNSEDLE